MNHLQQSIVTLRAEELTYPEIAERLNMDESAVHHQVKSLRKQGVVLPGSRVDTRKNWTPERLALLEKLCLGRKHSAGQIAAELGAGITRNAVIGMANRRGWPLSAPSPHSHRARATQQPAKPPAPRQQAARPSLPATPRPPLHIAHAALDPIPIPVPLPATNGNKVTLFMLTSKTCRWPIGDPGEPGFHFCGKPPSELRPYCEYHTGLAYVPARRRA